MKRQNILTIILLWTGSFSFCFAQNNPATDPYAIQLKIYQQSMKLYDLPTATMAMHHMIALNPSKTDLNDSLALLYFAQERFPQAIILGEEILKTGPEKVGIRELVAVSKQNIGMTKESLAEYEKLYEQSKSLFFLYQMASLQYQLKRYGECVASVDQILGQADADKQKVNIRTQSGSQDVPMKAAALNIKGICAMELNQPDNARANFTKALEIFPEFVLAKGNLENMNKSQSPIQETEAPGNKKPAKKGK